MEHVQELEHAELGLVGAVVQSAGRALDDLHFPPSDLRQPVLEAVMHVLHDMRAQGKPVDVITVQNELTNQGARVDPGLLHKAVEISPSPASAKYYAEIVQDAAARRRVDMAGRAIMQLAHQPGSVDALIDKARSTLDKNTQVTEASPVEFIWETMQDTVEGFDTPDAYIETPWQSLNDIIGGLRAGALYTIGARPAVGKSVIGVELALSMARYGGVALFSMEMSQDDVNKRVLANQLEIAMNRLMTAGALTAQDRQKIHDWQQQYRHPLAVNKSPATNIEEIRRFSRNVDRRVPLSGVVVDYLQLMAQAPADKRSRQEFVSDMSRNLKLLAIELDVPVVMLSQLNRESQSRQDPTPRLSDLRESGSIEQDSDVVMLLDRDVSDPYKAADLDMIIAKNRQGRPGALTFAFAGHYSKIREHGGGF